MFLDHIVECCVLPELYLLQHSSRVAPEGSIVSGIHVCTKEHAVIKS